MTASRRLVRPVANFRPCDDGKGKVNACNNGKGKIDNEGERGELSGDVGASDPRCNRR